MLAFKSSDIDLKFFYKNEIQILRSLDIPPQFVSDLTYIRMKQSIDKVKAYLFLKTLEEGHVFVATLKKMLDKAHIPDTFLYMAMVESNFLANAKSHKKAAGLWQMLPQTARKYHLTINSRVDERLDPVKSTVAAIEYLTYLHKRFKKWYLVAIAYNGGENRLARAIKKAKSDRLEVLIDPKKGYLPKETRLYVRKIIITALLAHNRTTILKKLKHRHEKFDVGLKEIPARKGDSLPLISKKLNVPIKVLKKYNPHLLKGVVPKSKKRFCIYIPEDRFNEKRSICASEPIFMYTVRPGDTLFLISKRFNNRLRALKALNRDINPSKIRVGTKIAVIGPPPKPHPRPKKRKPHHTNTGYKSPPKAKKPTKRVTTKKKPLAIRPVQESNATQKNTPTPKIHTSGSIHPAQERNATHNSGASPSASSPAMHEHNATTAHQSLHLPKSATITVSKPSDTNASNATRKTLSKK